MISSVLSPVILAFSGTLGDAFIVLCKLYSQHKITGEKYRLIRYSLHPGMDVPIEKMFKTVSFIEYLMPCKKCENVEEVVISIKKSKYKVVSTRWQEDEFETYSIDYNNFDPFPKVKTTELHLASEHFNVGIQLHCGSEGANFRGFSLTWLNKVREIMPSNKFSIYLFGTGASCYSKSEIASICEELKIINMVGKTDFHTFMGYIKAMDYFISLEGFGALFAMSQKVKTLLYNQYPYGIDGTVHPQWYNHGMIIHLNKNIFIRKLRSILNKRKIYSPAIPKGFFNLKPGSDIQ